MAEFSANYGIFILVCWCQKDINKKYDVPQSDKIISSANTFRHCL